MSTTILSFSVSKKEAEEINVLAKKQNRSRSQVIKEALQLYAFENTWRDLRQTGDIIAKRLGIESDDEVEQLFG